MIASATSSGQWSMRPRATPSRVRTPNSAFRCCEDCLPTLDEEARPVATVVRRFCTGGLGALFNRPTSLAVDSGVCAISLRDMPPEHVAAATLIVARWLWELVRRDQSPPSHRLR